MADALFGNVSQVLDASWDVAVPEWLYTNNWLIWGLLPFLGSNLGFWPSVLVLELAIRLKLGKPIECALAFARLWPSCCRCCNGGMGWARVSEVMVFVVASAKSPCTL